MPAKYQEETRQRRGIRGQPGQHGRWNSYMDVCSGVFPAKPSPAPGCQCPSSALFPSLVPIEKPHFWGSSCPAFLSRCPRRSETVYPCLVCPKVWLTRGQHPTPHTQKHFSPGQCPCCIHDPEHPSLESREPRSAEANQQKLQSPRFSFPDPYRGLPKT